jgi:23S rRNA maturation mini-RNase III
MAYRYNNMNIDGTMDTTLGLIMRLNFLWTDAQTNAIQGNYVKWNFVLDAIWRNLLYRDELETEKIKDKEGNVIKIISVKLSDDDQKLWDKLNLNVISSMKDTKNAKSSKQCRDAMKDYYKALQMKDVGLRKFQHKLHLYVKEKSKNPSNAMWGG